MKKAVLMLAFAMALVSLVACKKKKEEEATPTESIAEGFRFKDDTGTEFTADSAYYVSASTHIRAFRTGNNITITMQTSDPGTYEMTGSSGSQPFILTDSNISNYYAATEGKLVIKSKSNNRLTGTFSTTGSGFNSSLSGSFNIPIR